MRAFKVLFLLFMLFTVCGVTEAQGFAVSYPPDLKELELYINETYEFPITVINNLGEPLMLEIQSNAEGMEIYVTSSLYVSANGTRTFNVRIMPTAEEFKGFIRLIVRAGESGAVIAGSVTIPIEGHVPGYLPMWAFNETFETFNVTVNETLTIGEPLVNETFEFNVSSVSNEANVSTITEPLQEQPSESLEANEKDQSELFVEASENSNPSSLVAVKRSSSLPKVQTTHSQNILIYFVLAGLLGVFLGKKLKERRGDEEAYLDNYSAYDAY